MKRILVVTQVGKSHPSGFVRGYIYQDLFRAQGYDADFIDRKHSRLLKWIENPSKPFRFLSKEPFRFLIRVSIRVREAFVDRWIVKSCTNYDVVFFSKVVTAPKLMKAVKDKGVPIVLDFVDAVWLPGRQVPTFLESVQQATRVTTDNYFNLEFSKQMNPQSSILPDPPQVEAFDAYTKNRSKKTNPETVTLGWIGSPGTLYNLFHIWEALEEISKKYPHVRLRLVGTGKDTAGRIPPFERLKVSTVASYNQAKMIEEVFLMDVGLFPLQDLDTCRARGCLKTMIYMAGGVPVVASPVGDNSTEIQDGINGFLAKDKQEWIEKLEKLILDPNLRTRVGTQGLEYVRKNYSVEACFESLVSALKLASQKPETRGESH